jgi:hypothetical protein
MDLTAVPKHISGSGSVPAKYQKSFYFWARRKTVVSSIYSLTGYSIFNDTFLSFSLLASSYPISAFPTVPAGRKNIFGPFILRRHTLLPNIHTAKAHATDHRTYPYNSLSRWPPYTSTMPSSHQNHRNPPSQSHIHLVIAATSLHNLL